MCQTIDSILDDACKKALLDPYVKHASDALAGTRFRDMLSHECQAQLMGDFCRLLVACAQDAIDASAARVLAQENWLRGLNAALALSADQMRARDAVAAQLDASGADVVDEEAPLLRTELERQTERFVATTVELLERVWQDRNLIANDLLGRGLNGEIGLIRNLDSRLGDCHDGGRKTAVITCEAGRFVYKPRDCSIDSWFSLVSQKYLAGALRQPHAIVRNDESGHWGFEEFIERKPVTSEEGVARYWRNFGRAAALFQALGSEDLHCENFVAAGEVPSLIDSETVITSEPTHLGDPLTSPNLADASKGFGHDIAGTLATSSLLPALLEDDINSSPLIARGSRCLPLWEGSERDVLGYRDDFLAGFDEGWAQLAARAAELEDDMRAATHMPVRRLIRNTAVYVQLLERLRLVDAYDPAKRAGLLSILHRPLVRGIDATKSPLATSEISCLLEGDIPYFYAEAGSHMITGSDGTSDARLLAASAQERALKRIRALDEAHRSFSHAVLALNINLALVAAADGAPPCVLAGDPLSSEAALEEACAIFDRLERLVIESPSGESSWHFRSGHRALIHSSVALGNGLGGVAVFLAAIAPQTRDTRTRSLALERLAGCLDRIDEVIAHLEVARVIPEHSASLGMADGLGGVLRTLDLVVGALDAGGETTLASRNRAHGLRERLLGLLSRADVEHATQADVYAGASGLLLALSECPVASHGEAAATIAERLTRRILELRGVGEDGRLWDTLGTSWPISGFGHGQAGIAAALAQGARVFGVNANTAALDALAFELTAYNERIGTWPDLRENPASDRHMHGICSGAPGVGLAAHMAYESAAEQQARDLARELLKRADATCKEHVPQPRDVLCCGNLSVVEYLLERGERRRAGRLLAGVLRRKRELGSYVVNHPQWRQTDDPSLLWGLSGIGYLLLRYADPSLTSVF